MSDLQTIKIPRTSDLTIVDCFKVIGEKYNTTKATVSALAFSQIGEIDLFNNENLDFETLKKYNSALLNSINIHVGGLSITYYRGGSSQPQNNSPIFDEIHLRWNAQGKLTNSEKLDIISIINEKLKSFEHGRVLKTGLSEDQSILLSIHNSTLERLERLNEDLIRQSSDFRHNLEQRFNDKADKLAQELKNQSDELIKEYELKSQDLEKREQTLADKFKAFDDRDNTHVRREIRDKMLSDVKERIEKFGVSKGTEGKRTPVLIGIFSMILAIVALLLYSIFEVRAISTALDAVNASNLQTTYLLWIKISFLTLALFGTILYYIKWQNRWAEQHANTEFQLQQFYIDINRANWVIESCLEWKNANNSVIPTILLESITRNLFDRQNEELERVLHPSDELASALLGSASRLKMKIGDNELEFDKPGKIKPRKLVAD